MDIYIESFLNNDLVLHQSVINRFTNKGALLDYNKLLYDGRNLTLIKLATDEVIWTEYIGLRDYKSYKFI